MLYTAAGNKALALPFPPVHSLCMLQEQHEQLQLVAALMRGHLLTFVLQQLDGCIKLLHRENMQTRRQVTFNNKPFCMQSDQHAA